MAKILVVDDSWLTRRGLSNMLKPHGHVILEAESGSQALDMVKSNPPDVMLLDLLMPEMHGTEVLSILKEESLAIPVIVITADIQDTVREHCMNLGAMGFVNKPPNEEALIDLISKALVA